MPRLLHHISARYLEQLRGLLKPRNKRARVQKRANMSTVSSDSGPKSAFLHLNFLSEQ